MLTSVCFSLCGPVSRSFLLPAVAFGIGCQVRRKVLGKTTAHPMALSSQLCMYVWMNVCTSVSHLPLVWFLCLYLLSGPTPSCWAELATKRPTDRCWRVMEADRTSSLSLRLVLSERLDRSLLSSLTLPRAFLLTPGAATAASILRHLFAVVGVAAAARFSFLSIRFASLLL